MFRQIIIFSVASFCVASAVNAQTISKPAKVSKPNKKAIYDSTIKSAWKLTKGKCGAQIEACLAPLKSERVKDCKPYRKCTKRCKKGKKKAGKAGKACLKTCRKNHLTDRCKKSRVSYVKNVVGCGISRFKSGSCRDKLNKLAGKVGIAASSKKRTASPSSKSKPSAPKGTVSGNVKPVSKKIPTKASVPKKSTRTSTSTNTSTSTEPSFECHSAEAKMMAAHLVNKRTPKPKKLGANPHPQKARTLVAKSNSSMTAKATPNSTMVHHIDDRYTSGAKWRQQDRVTYQFKVKGRGSKSEFRVCSLLIDTKRKKSRTVGSESARLSGKSSAISDLKITAKLDKYHDRWGSERQLVTYLVVRNRSKKTALNYEVSLRRSKPKSIAQSSAKPKTKATTKKQTTEKKNGRPKDPAPGKLTLAKIAEAAYASDLIKATQKDCGKPNSCMPAGYRNLVDGVTALPYLGKFQSVAVLNTNTKTPSLVIAYRGTWSTGSLHTDVGLFQATMIDSSCVRNAIRDVARLCPMPKNYSKDKMTTFKCISGHLKKNSSAAKCNLEMRKVAEVLAFGERFYEGALRKAKTALNGKTPKVYVTGHSLGGYIATYVASKYNAEASVFNAPPGARYALLSSRSKAPTLDQKVNNKITNYRINDDVVSSFAGWNRSGTPLGHTGRVCTYPGPDMKPKLKAAIMDTVKVLGATMLSKKARNSTLDFFATGIKLTSHKMTTVIEKIEAGNPTCKDAPANRYFY